jgi:deoxyxylulose-5-phosphate synthase
MINKYCKTLRGLDRHIITTFRNRLSDLEIAIHTLNDIPICDKSNITTTNGSTHDKNFILSIIKVLKDIDWLAQDKNGKYSRTMKIQVNTHFTN